MAGAELLSKGPRRRLTPAACQAAVLILAVLVGLYAFLHYVQTHLTRYPFLVLLFPPVASIGLALPLMMFLSYQADFPRLQPVRPTHYWRIARRCYAALARNNFKVSEKDL